MSPDRVPTKQCGKYVSWWEGEYEGNCELPQGHDGDHWDGLSWFDDDGEMADHRHDGEPGSGVARDVG